MKLERQSNLELLRVVAMFMVLVVHSDFISIGIPTVDDFQVAPLSSFARLFFEAISIIGVNLFVLLSGWFGINLNKRSFCNILFQSLFLSVFTAIITQYVDIFFNVSIWSDAKGNLVRSFLEWNWFVYSYLFLMVISPIINKYVENSNKNNFGRLLFGFFFMQTILDLSGLVDFYAKGYSPIYLLGIYLLGRYIKVYKPKFADYNKKTDFLLYICMVVLITVFSSLLINFRTGITGYAYTNPLIIIASVYCFLFFAKTNIKTNKIINFLATSSFAVLLVHTNYSFISLFIMINKGIYDLFYGLKAPLMMFFFMIIIYIISVMIDQIRIYVWNLIIKHDYHIYNSVILDRLKKYI